MRKKFFLGLPITLLGALALWCFIVLSDSSKYVRANLIFIGTTNSADQRLALFALPIPERKP